MKHISEITKEYLIELAKNNPEAAAAYAWEVREDLNKLIKNNRILNGYKNAWIKLVQLFPGLIDFETEVNGGDLVQELTGLIDSDLIESGLPVVCDNETK